VISNRQHRDILVTVLLCVATVFVSVVFFRGGSSADLVATYFAGQEYAAGHFDRIYPSDSQVFDLSYPDSWRALALDHGLGDMPLFPYIYPPLWAALAAPVTGWSTPQSIFTAATILNPLLLVGTICLAWRAARPAIALPTWTALGILATFPTLIGFIALHQNQPQILVSFLIVLALERNRSGDKISAGAAMALAASIKLYPILFIIVWLARRDWVTVKWFALTGVLLAAASLWLGGVALNLTFLRQVTTINNTVMITQLTINLDSFLGQFLLQETLTQNAQAAPGMITSTGLHSAKPFLFGLISKFALLLVLVATWRHAQRASDAELYKRLWPGLLLLISIFSPLSWSYHFISMGAFLPLLLAQGIHSFRFWGALVVLLAISVPGVSYLASLPAPFFLVQAVATLGFGFLAALFLLPTTKNTREFPTRNWELNPSAH